VDLAQLFGNVVVGIDGRQGGHDAIALARRLMSRDGHLTLVHVSAAGLTYVQSAHLALALRADSRRLLEQARAAAEVDAELISTPAPSVGRGLHEIVERQHAGLLVVGSCHRGFLGRVLVGNDTRSSLNGAGCAVAVAPLAYAHEPRPITTVGVGYDGSRESRAALAFARKLAGERGCGLRALKVIPVASSAQVGFGGVAWGDELDSVLADAKREMAALEDVDGDAVLGIPGEELAAFGEQVGVLIVGSRGYGPLRSMMLGSSSRHLASHGRCPLLVLSRAS